MRNYLRVGLEEAKAGPRVIEVLARHGVLAVKGVQTRDTLVVLTGEVAESCMVDAMRGLEGMSGVQPAAVRLRVEELA
jgi:hypothetical protein